MSCSPRHRILILQSYTSTLSTFEYPKPSSSLDHTWTIRGESPQRVRKSSAQPNQCNCTTACSLVFISNCPKKKTQQEVRAWSTIAFWEEVQDYDTTVKEITVFFTDLQVTLCTVWLPNYAKLLLAASSNNRNLQRPNNYVGLVLQCLAPEFDWLSPGWFSCLLDDSHTLLMTSTHVHPFRLTIGMK